MMKQILLIGLMALCPLSASAQTRYSITDMGKLNTIRGGVTAINERGEVVGGDGHGFLWTGSEKIDLRTLPPTGPEDDTTEIAYGINNREQIVGASGSFGPIFMSGLQFARGVLVEGRKARQLTEQDASFIPYAINDSGEIAGLNAYRGFFYAHGKLIPLGTLSRVPNGNRSLARAINQRGQVVGWSTVNHTRRSLYDWLPTHAFLWHRGADGNRLRDLGTLPGWVNSYANGINDQGEVIGAAAGVSNTPSGPEGVVPTQAFLWRDGRMTALPNLPGGNSSAFGINDSVEIVGSCDSRAVVWRLGKITDLNTYLPPGSGWTLEEAQAINNRGQIAGTGTFHGQLHLFLLTPNIP